MHKLLRPGVFGIVLVLHIAVLSVLFSARETPHEQPVIVTMIALPAPQQPEAQPHMPQPQPHRPQPQHRQQQPRPEAQPGAIAAERAPAPVAPVAPAAPEAVPQEPARAPGKPKELPGELSVSCPGRTAPAYPAHSLRLGEQGHVMLTVELDETGRVTGASVKNSSGFARLDQAALNAVKTWRCKPALQEGRAVPAVALQPFSFTLEDR